MFFEFRYLCFATCAVLCYLHPLLCTRDVHVGVSGVSDITELAGPPATEYSIQPPQLIDATPPSQNGKSVTGPMPSSTPQLKEKQQGGGAITNGGMTSYIYLLYCCAKVSKFT